MIAWLLAHLGLANVNEGDFLVKLIGLVGAGTAFVVAILQYRRSEVWRRNEFVAMEMKSFFTDPRVRNALLMIDWSARRINIELDEKIKIENCPRITRSLQIASLIPHTVKDKWQTSAEATENMEARLTETKLGGYSLIEGLIRDTYDGLLDGLARFFHFVEAGLVRAEEMEPYLRYWIKDISRTDLQGREAEWQLALLTYIEFYEFDGVQNLFEKLGHDIRPSGQLWKQLDSVITEKGLVGLLKQSVN